MRKLFSKRRRSSAKFLREILGERRSGSSLISIMQTISIGANVKCKRCGVGIISIETRTLLWIRRGMSIPCVLAYRNDAQLVLSNEPFSRVVQGLRITDSISAVPLVAPWAIANYHVYRSAQSLATLQSCSSFRPVSQLLEDKRNRVCGYKARLSFASSIGTTIFDVAQCDPDCEIYFCAIFNSSKFYIF